MPLIRTVKSQRGTAIVVYNYRYVKWKVLANGNILWRCGKVGRCKATVTTDPTWTSVSKWGAEHNHEGLKRAHEQAEDDAAPAEDGEAREPEKSPPPKTTPVPRRPTEKSKLCQKAALPVTGPSRAQPVPVPAATKESFKIYGEFVGDSICNLNNQRLQSWARHQISNILYAAEEASYSGHIPTTKDLDVSLRPMLPNLDPFLKIEAVNTARLSIADSHVGNGDSLSLSRPSGSISIDEVDIKEEPLFSNLLSPSPNVGNDQPNT